MGGKWWLSDPNTLQCRCRSCLAKSRSAVEKREKREKESRDARCVEARGVCMEQECEYGCSARYRACVLKDYSFQIILNSRLRNGKAEWENVYSHFG